jgi:hypothetical protein
MAVSNAERQRQYIARLKAAAGSASPDDVAAARDRAAELAELRETVVNQAGRLTALRDQVADLQTQIAALERRLDGLERWQADHATPPAPPAAVTTTQEPEPAIIATTPPPAPPAGTDGKPKRQLMTPEKKAEILRRSSAGEGPTAIGRVMNIPQPTVSQTITRAKKATTGAAPE